MIAWFFACARPPELPELGELPRFELVDQTDTAFSSAALDGRVWVANFIFTSCPDVCPILSARMSELQTHYAGDPRVHLVSFSVDPRTDTPPVLSAYAARFGADAVRWHFLTGEISSVKQVVTVGFKMVMEPTSAEGKAPAVLHGERFVVVDQRGHIRGYPDPKEPALSAVYDTVDRLLAD